MQFTPLLFRIASILRVAQRVAMHLRVFVITPFLHLGDPNDPNDRMRQAYTAPHLFRFFAKRIVSSSKRRPKDERSSNWGSNQIELFFKALVLIPRNVRVAIVSPRVPRGMSRLTSSCWPSGESELGEGHARSAGRGRNGATSRHADSRRACWTGNAVVHAVLEMVRTGRMDRSARRIERFSAPRLLRRNRHICIAVYDPIRLASSSSKPGPMPCP